MDEFRIVLKIAGYTARHDGSLEVLDILGSRAVHIGYKRRYSWQMVLLLIDLNENFCFFESKV